MVRLDPQKKTDSTGQRPAKWKWRLKFFASICLFAFMGGLMLGTVFKQGPAPFPELLQVRAQGAALELCFSRLPRAAVPESPGMFVMLLAVVKTEEQKGALQLAGGETVSWRLEPRQDGMQLGFVGMQPVQGRWEQVPDSPCIRVDIATADVE